MKNDKDHLDNEGGRSSPMEVQESASQTASPELLPCPFCGCREPSFNAPDGDFRGSINCPSCLVSMPREINDDAELIGCWNSRTPDSCGRAVTQASEAERLLDELTDQLRDALFSKYCRGCGTKELPCYCQRDD